MNAVKWIQSTDQSLSNQFLSVSDDSVCIHWILNKNLDVVNKFSIKGHKESITAVDSIYINNILTIVTVSSDSSIKLWQRHNNDDYECIQSICLNGGLCLAMRAFNLQKNKDCAVLAFATDDHKVYLYAKSKDDFVKVDTLIGHEDWVRSLDFIQLPGKKFIIKKKKLSKRNKV